MSSLPPLPPPLPSSAAALGDPTVVRQTYLSHEASIRSIASLHFLGALLFAIVASSSIFTQEPLPSKLAVAALSISVALLQFYIGRGLKRLDPSARTVATVVAVIGLLGFPIGTLINAYILYLLRSAKSTVVFSDEYKGVMAATPDIKYRSSLGKWILIGVLVVLVFTVVMILIVSK